MCKSRKLLAVVMAAATIISATPVTAMAAEDVTEPVVVETESASESGTPVVEETPVVTSSGHDETAPVVTSISTDKSSYDIGDVCTFTMNITEEGTGIQSVRLMVQSTVTGKYFSFQAAGCGNGNALTGTYTAAFPVDSRFTPGTWRLVLLTTTDIAGNKALNDSWLYENFVEFDVNGEAGDTTAPKFDKVSVSKTNINAGDTNVAIVECHDADLATIKFLYQSTETSQKTTKQVTLNVVDHIASSGLYYLVFPSDENDIGGEWYICEMYLTDTAGNTSDNYCTCYYNINSNSTVDNEKPVITSVSTSKNNVSLPGVANITVAGTENVSDTTVSIAVRLVNREVKNAEMFVDFDATVVDGKFEATENIDFATDTNPGTWVVDWVRVDDEAGNWTDSLEYDYVEYTLVNGIENVYGEAALSNSNLDKIIEQMGDGETLLIDADTNIIPANVFTALCGTSKTIVVDLDGVEWIINGSTINSCNIKDVDISATIGNASSMYKYGYKSNTKGVILSFANNGILPGTVKIRIKSDYIVDKFDLNSSLFLACIKGTIDDSHEYLNYMNRYTKDENGNDVYYTYDAQYDKNGILDYVKYYFYDKNGHAIVDKNGNQKTYTQSVDGNYNVNSDVINQIIKVNYTNDTPVQIEAAGIEVSDDGYVTFTMNHNSDYILTDELPTSTEVNARYIDTTETVVERQEVDDEQLSIVYDSTELKIATNIARSDVVEAESNDTEASNNTVAKSNDVAVVNQPSVKSEEVVTVTKSNDSNEKAEEVKSNEEAVVEEVKESNNDAAEVKSNDNTVVVSNDLNTSNDTVDEYVAPSYEVASNDINDSVVYNAVANDTTSDVVEEVAAPVSFSAKVSQTISAAFVSVKTNVVKVFSSIFNFFANLF